MSGYFKLDWYKYQSTRCISIHSIISTSFRKTTTTKRSQLSALIVPQNRHDQNWCSIPASPQVRHVHPSLTSCGRFVIQASHWSANGLFSNVHIWQAHSEFDLAGGDLALGLWLLTESFRSGASFNFNEDSGLTKFGAAPAWRLAAEDEAGPAIGLGTSSTMITSESESSSEVKSMTLFSIPSLAAFSASR